MTTVGSAYIHVHAITDKVDGEIRKGFSNINTNFAGNAGKKMAKSFSHGFQSSSSKNVMGKFADGLKEIAPKAEKTRKHFANLVRTGYFLNGALGGIIGGLSAVGGGLTALIGAAGGASASLIVLANGGFAMAAGMVAAKIALGGVGKALSALNKQGKGAADNTKQIEDAETNLARVIESNREALIEANNDVRDAQLALNQAIKDGAEEIQQLGFSAEEAALSESKAALELEKARETLMRVQDLPPNSRARKEAELAFQEAELNLRMAKDKSADLNKEQNRLAKTGVAGTEAVINATNALAQAETKKAKTVRDGLRQQADAEKQLADAKKGNDSGGTDPFAGLTKSQIEFVQNLQTLKPLYKELQESLAAALLPKLWDSISMVADKAFETIKVGLTKVAGSLGNASISLATAITEAGNLADLGTVFSNSATLIESLGRTMGSVWGSAMSLLVAAGPMTQRFATSIETAAAKFDAFLNTKQATGELQAFFDRAGQIMADLGAVFGNIFKGIGGIIMANFGPGSGGDIMIQWLKDATSGFANIGKDGQAVGFFQDLARNSISVFQAVGSLLKEIGKLGAMKEVGQTFDILKTGAPFVGTIMQEAVKAGPALASLITTIAEILSLLADANQSNWFFNTLNYVATKIRDFLATELVQKILDILGPIMGVISAVGMMGSIFVSVASLMIGYMILMSKGIGLIQTRFQQLGAMISKHPLIAILVLITALIVILYNTNQEFADQMNAIFAQLQAALVPLGAVFAQVFGVLAQAFNDLMASGVIDSLVNALAQILIVVVQLAAGLITGLIPVVSVLIEAFGTVMSTLMPIITQILQVVADAILQLVPVLLPLVDVIVQLFGTLMAALAPLIPVLIDALVPIIQQLADLFLNSLGTVLNSMIPLIMSLADAFIQIMNVILPLIPVLIAALIPAFMAILDALLPLIPTLLDALIPAILMLVEAFLPLISVIIDSVMPIIVMLIETLMPLITTLIDALMPAITSIIEAFAPFLPLLIDLIMMGLNVLMPIIKMLADIFAALLPPIMSVVKFIISMLLPVFSWIIDAVGNVIRFIPQLAEGFKNVFNGIASFVRNVWNGILGFIEGGINMFIDMLNGLLDGYNIIAGALGLAKAGRVPKVHIARLAEGGIVSPAGGGQMALIAEAGRPERVEPLDPDGLSKRDKKMIEFLVAKQGGGGGVTINVQAAPGMDERELAAAVSREITFQMRKGAVA